MKLKSLLSSGMALIMLTSAFSIPVFAEDKLVAFPGAEGGGMYTQGARAASNYEIYHVTNLNDSGTGSFRDAVSKGNRIIVFDVAGTVMLEKELEIRASNLTILGQTAPGEGICIGGESVRFTGANEIILRYLRFRMGDKSTSQEDALGIRGGKNIIVDHCSVSWSVDECLSIYENMNTTVQNCIVSEALKNSNHSKGAHGYGGIWGGINASFHHNLIATNDSRNPRIGTSYTVSNYHNSSDTDNLVDIRNNVIYNWGGNSSYGGENGVRVNIVNNYYKPSDLTDKNHINFYDPYKGNDDMSTTLHLSGNIMEGYDNLTENNWLGVSSAHSSTFTKREDISAVGAEDAAQKPNDEFLANYPVVTTDAQIAYDYVLENAGASRFRDDVDTRVINDVKNGTYPTGSKGSVNCIDSQNDVGGWPALHGSKTADSDNDGMSDEWEGENGLNPNSDDSLIIAANGYTNIENYANYLAEQTYSGYEVDTSKLKAELVIAKSLDQSAYSEVDRTRLNEAIANAEAVYYLVEPTKTQIDEQYEALRLVVDSLYVDYTDALKETIETAKNKDISGCTNESANPFNEVLAKAEKDLAENKVNEYEGDIAAIEDAMKGLKKGYKGKLKKDIDFLLNADLSHLIYSDRQKIKTAVQPFIALYNDTSKTDSELCDERLNIFDIVKNGSYNRINPGRTVELQDFESGEMFDSEGKYSCMVYSSHTDKVNCEVVDGYGTNHSKVLKVSTASTDSAIYLKSVDTVPDHYMISFDYTTESGISTPSLYACKEHSGLFSYMFEEGENIAYSSGSNKLNSIDYELSGFGNRHGSYGHWTNLAMEIDKPKEKVTYYINDIPICSSDYKDFDMNYYGFSFGYGSTNYYDNLKLVDLSEEPTYLEGDCDNNGIVTANDAAQCLTRVLDADTPTVMETLFGDDAMKYIDMDGSGGLTSNDAAMILAKALDNTVATTADKLVQIN